MKKGIITALLTMAFVSTQAQVGIDTDTPTETLNVNGTVRINELPADGTASAINTKEDGTKSSTKDQTFKATKTVVADENGVLGTVEVVPEQFKTKFDSREVTTTQVYEDTTGSDGILLKESCLQLMLDPNYSASTYYVDLKMKIDRTCNNSRGEVYVAITATGGDSGDATYQNFNRINFTTTDILNDTFKSDDFTDRTMSHTPLISGKIALIDVHQVYEYTYYTNWNSAIDGVGKYQLGLTLKRIQ